MIMIKRVSSLLWLTGVLLSLMVSVAFPQPSGNQQESVVVGRIAHVDGQLLRYVSDDQDWVATLKDSPFGLNDALYSDDNSRAEFIMPNGTWVRIGTSTQIQLISLDEDVTEVDVASGVARFYNKSSDTVIKATTPFGYILAAGATSFDLYVGDESVEVVALQGTVNFVHGAGDAKYEVIADGPSILADDRQVSSGEATVDAAWDAWNSERDNLWSKRAQVRGDSVEQLPAQLRDEAYTLEEQGKWEEVEYEGARRRLWRPVRVEAGWAPFTAGRWTEWYGDNCWVPDEPFGYVTHHYGNWVYVRNGWYWMPPVARARVVAGPVVGLGWYPGRVAWIHSGAEVGWVPLAPSEPYYSHRHWGARSIVVAGGAAAGISIGLANLSYVGHAVVVNQHSFYGVNNYRTVRVTNLNRTTIINNYRAAPVVNNTVINNYNNIRQRHNFTNVQVTRKPHQTVINRIQQNEVTARKEGRVKGKALEQDVARIKQGKPAQGTRVAAPKYTDKIVPADAVAKPKSEVKFPERQPKAKAAVKPRPVAIEKPGLEPPEGKPVRPGRPEPAAPVRDEEPKVKPARPEAPERVKPGRVEPLAQPDRGEPKVKPTHPEQPEKVRPGRPEPAAPVRGEERKVKPTLPEAPERVKPGKPEPQAPGGREEPKMKPGRPEPRERVKPVRPEAPLQTGGEQPRVKQPKPELPQAGPHGQPGPQNQPDQKKKPKSPKELEQQ